MKKTTALFLLTAAASTTAWGQSSPDIIPALKRADTVKFAKSLIAPQPQAVPAADDTALKDPFNPAQLPPSSTPSSPTADGGLTGSTPSGESAQLAQIAPNIKPTGAVKIGDESLLLFGQKRSKVGDRLPIIFEGRPYELEIVDIQSTSFTLRLNGVEITRPIKSVTKPVTKP